MEKYNFGDLVYGEFPFAEAILAGRDDGKNRWVFVLKDLGETVMVCYCTSNPEPKDCLTVRLGALADGRVTNLVPGRVEAIQKQRIVVSKGRQRIEFAHVIAIIGRTARDTPKYFFGLATEVVAECRLQLEYAAKRAQKKAAKKQTKA